MISKLYGAAFMATVILISCRGGNDNDYIDKSLITPAAENNVAQAADTVPPAAQTSNSQPLNATGSTSLPVTMSPGTNSIQINPQAVTTPPVVAGQQTTNAKLNPAHGQPGHRCDIAVGAPLDSKPVQPTNTVTTAQPPVNVSTQPTAQTTAPGMNPPHGQPNHRCDIAVGAPLNSPVAPTQTPVPPVTIDPSVSKPPKQDSVKNQ